MTQNYHILKQYPSKKEEEELKFPLFSKQDYWKFNLADSTIHPISFRNSLGQMAAFWCFVNNQNSWNSPLAAPFYLPFLADDTGLIETLIDAVKELKLLHYQAVQITLPPLTESSIIQELVPSYFRIDSIAVGYHLKVDHISFEQKISLARKQQKLRALRKDNYNISEVSSQNWTEVYDQNISWRAKKQHRNYISSKKFSDLKQYFPKYYTGFQIKQSNQLIGTAFIVKVSDQLLYVYSLITDPEFDENEPSLLLWEVIYSYAKEGGYQFIDMGTSMLPGKQKINKNLALYKASIGGEIYRKYSLIC